jgi:hypothetical protein
MSGLLAQLGVADELLASPPTVTSVVFAAGVPNTGTVTTGTAHNLRVGDVVTFTGAVPAGWNGTWVVQSVTSSTVFVIWQPTTLANTSTQPTLAATRWGNTTTVNRFYEFVSEGMKLRAPRMVSTALRAGNKVSRSDRSVPDRQGVTGPVVLEVKTKAFGLLLKHLMGTITTTGPTDSCYTHTATIGLMQGRGLTGQVGRPVAGSTYVQAFTFNGCKVMSWEFTCSVGGILMLNLTLLAQDGSVSTALAVASYPTGDELFTFGGGRVQINSLDVGLAGDISIACDMGLAERRFTRQSLLPAEPLEANKRTYTVRVGAEFSDMLHYNRFSSATQAGRSTAVTISWTAPTLAGASTYPSITFTMPSVAFDEAEPTVAGPELLRADLVGMAENSTGGTQDALSIAYVTTDATP